MRTLFLSSLLHGPCDDPGLWVDLLEEGRSVLLDLSDLRHVVPRKLLRVERAIVTHTHMDHFIGFDQLLRLALGREKELVVTGPPGFLRRVEGRIGAYTWNLIEEYPVRIRVEEVDGDLVRSAVYTGTGRMRPEPQPDRPFDGTLHAERLFTVHGALLDHGIPVLGVALRETEHISVNRDRLERLGLRPGPWLRELKQAVRRCESMDEPIEADAEGGARRFRRGDLVEEIILRRPGQRVAYVTDLRYTEENAAKVVELAWEVDLLVCEAAFLDRDADLARARCHLTARQAGEIARAARAQRLAPFHLSPRYLGREEEIFREAADSFGGPVLRLPTEAERAGAARPYSPWPGE